jgi:hypothetical protein
MDAIHIDGMLHVLRPQLRDPEMAKQILQHYWRDRVAFVWTVEQVHLAANERGLAISREQARRILDQFHKETDRFTPLNWFRLLDLIDEADWGRKLTKSELNRFLQTNLIVVAKA